MRSDTEDQYYTSMGFDKAHTRFQHPCLYRELLQADWFANYVESVNNTLKCGAI